MNRDECHGEHAVTGEILVDGVPIHPGLLTCMIEMGCRHGLLVARDPYPEPSSPPEDERFVEPDAS